MMEMEIKGGKGRTVMDTMQASTDAVGKWEGEVE